MEKVTKLAFPYLETDGAIVVGYNPERYSEL